VVVHPTPDQHFCLIRGGGVSPSVGPFGVCRAHRAARYCRTRAGCVSSSPACCRPLSRAESAGQGSVPSARASSALGTLGLPSAPLPRGRGQHVRGCLLQNRLMLHLRAPARHGTLVTADACRTRLLPDSAFSHHDKSGPRGPVESKMSPVSGRLTAQLSWQMTGYAPEGPRQGVAPGALPFLDSRIPFWSLGYRGPMRFGPVGYGGYVGRASKRGLWCSLPMRRHA
jgi:hypothetical protein